MHRTAACNASPLAKALGVASTKTVTRDFLTKMSFFENFVPQIPEK